MTAPLNPCPLCGAEAKTRLRSTVAWCSKFSCAMNKIRLKFADWNALPRHMPEKDADALIGAAEKAHAVYCFNVAFKDHRVAMAAIRAALTGKTEPPR